MAQLLHTNDIDGTHNVIMAVTKALPSPAAQFVTLAVLESVWLGLNLWCIVDPCQRRVSVPV